MFKKTFKFYKRKNPSPDLHDVIDFDLYECSNSQQSWYNVSTYIYMYACLYCVRMFKHVLVHLYLQIFACGKTIVGETCECF